MRVGLCALAALLAAPPLAGQATGPQLTPKIAFEKDAVVASGMTRGGAVAWLSVSRDIAEQSATLVRRDGIVEDDDKDGEVRLELDLPLPIRTIFVAVDLTTGSSAVATPEGFPLRRFEIPTETVGRGVAGKPDWVADARRFVEILVVKPGVGAAGSAFGATVADGGPGDDDASNDGLLVAGLASMRPIRDGGPEPPDRFGAKDVVVVVDPNRMEVGVRQLVEAPR